MPQPDPTSSFAFTQWSRTSAAARRLRARSIWFQLLAVAALLVLVPLILIGLLLGAAAIAGIVAVRAAWMRVRSILPRNDGRENVRIVTRR